MMVTMRIFPSELSKLSKFSEVEGVFSVENSLLVGIIFDSPEAKVHEQSQGVF